MNRRRLGDMPLVVLSAGREWRFDTPDGRQVTSHYQKVWFAQHEALARLSTHGVHRIVDSGHTIQLEKPEAVTEAVDEVLRQLKRGRLP